MTNLKTLKTLLFLHIIVMIHNNKKNRKRNTIFWQNWKQCAEKGAEKTQVFVFYCQFYNTIMYSNSVSKKEKTPHWFHLFFYHHILVDVCFPGISLIKRKRKRSNVCVCLPVVVGLERSCLVEAKVLGLVIGQLRQMGIKGWQVKTGYILICQHPDKRKRLSVVEYVWRSEDMNCVQRWMKCKWLTGTALAECPKVSETNLIQGMAAVERDAVYYRCNLSGLWLEWRLYWWGLGQNPNTLAMSFVQPWIC